MTKRSAVHGTPRLLGDIVQVSPRMGFHCFRLRAFLAKALPYAQHTASNGEDIEALEGELAFERILVSGKHSSCPS